MSQLFVGDQRVTKVPDFSCMVTKVELVAEQSLLMRPCVGHFRNRGDQEVIVKKFGVVLSLVVCVMAATQAHAEKGTAIHQRATLVRAPSSRASVCRVEVLVDENYRATPDGLVLLADIYLTIYGSRGQEISHGDWQVTFTSASGAVGSFTLQPPSSEFPGQSGFASLVADFGDLSISAMPLGDVSGCAGVTLSKPIPVSGDRSSLDFPVETLFPGSPVTRLR